MAKIKIHAGDLPIGSAKYTLGMIQLPPDPKKSIFAMPDHIRPADFEELEVASEDSVKRVGGTVGWTTVGALALGPIGLVAGLVLGGRGKDVTFVGRLKDGRKILATTDSGTYKKLLAAIF